jgi:small subunit ribosomal protein S11
VAHVNSSFNNTKILISDVQGNAISWSSSGTMGFKGSRKSTPMPPRWPPKTPARRRNMATLEVEVQGPGSGRESALRALAAVGFQITSIRDVTPTRTTAAVRRSAAASKVFISAGSRGAALAARFRRLRSSGVRRLSDIGSGQE